MNRLEFPSSRGKTIRAAAADACGTPRIGLSETIKCLALQSTGSSTAESTGTGGLRGHALSCRGRVVERLDLFPARLGALEEDGLTVVSGGDEGGFGGKSQRGVGQRRGADDLYGRGRLAGAAGVDDADGRVVACGGLAELDRGKRGLTGKGQEVT